MYTRHESRYFFPSLYFFPVFSCLSYSWRWDKGNRFLRAFRRVYYILLHRKEGF